ncbi:hypothetical protein C463_03759 [Halorubrum californiense DSM 19288]|uniref:DUF7573 domain-containing protein n=1 Tax=Halorubrum californiense DSM 19288 TaxID=1227465 RepID=M0EI08_9EURY|nr:MULTISPECIES: hypothetical protein [Halorubrum]ELZ46713.1 hypothetical protein C463_03759 [Halorubrum californiense DSM 19288]TKX67852.1 hypothetical protein EXE40_14090 [Halorubrum sp. GN11GM_10-3_MGM]
MPDDRSLDDFAGDEDTNSGAAADTADDGTDGVDGDDAADSSPDDADSDAPSDPNDAVDPADVDQAVATSTWHADGAACDRCGESVDRRWRDDDALVCADCASW